MSEVTRILKDIENGDVQASAQLLPLVYEELRRLAAQRLAREPAGQTLQPTALVHEAYVRLVEAGPSQSWDSRGHFFAAAAEAMRRILVESARRRQTLKRGGPLNRAALDADDVAGPMAREDLLALDEALDRLEAADPEAARLVKLRYFAGLTMQQAAGLMELSERGAYRLWDYAKAWLHRELRN